VDSSKTAMQQRAAEKTELTDDNRGQRKPLRRWLVELASTEWPPLPWMNRRSGLGPLKRQSVNPFLRRSGAETTKFSIWHGRSKRRNWRMLTHGVYEASLENGIAGHFPSSAQSLSRRRGSISSGRGLALNIRKEPDPWRRFSRERLRRRFPKSLNATNNRNSGCLCRFAENFNVQRVILRSFLPCGRPAGCWAWTRRLHGAGCSYWSKTEFSWSRFAATKGRGRRRGIVTLQYKYLTYGN
jgi:hypothetical protein